MDSQKDVDMSVMSVSVNLSESLNIEEILNFRTPSLIVKRRSSFFKPDELPIKKKVKIDIRRDRYLEALEKEKMDWINLVQSTNNKIKASVLKEKVPVDSSILPKEQREYLDQAVDLPTWFKETEDFSQRTFGYIKKKEWLIMRLKYIQEQLENKLIDCSVVSF